MPVPTNTSAVGGGDCRVLGSAGDKPVLPKSPAVQDPPTTGPGPCPGPLAPPTRPPPPLLPLEGAVVEVRALAPPFPPSSMGIPFSLRNSSRSMYSSCGKKNTNYFPKNCTAIITEMVMSGRSQKIARDKNTNCDRIFPKIA